MATKPIYWTLFNGDLKHLERVMDNVTSDITGSDYFWNIHSNIINENFDGDWEWEDAIEFWALEDIEKALQMYREPTLDSEDDARDLSIHLTDNILNHFETNIPQDEHGYCWELQDLITELVMKRFNIEKEE
tara:strand:+ start:739 stop:1134 length:396 start_codon:yes stop_codon:yes gene_type:complete